jgi:hypothetical protein
MCDSATATQLWYVGKLVSIASALSLSLCVCLHLYFGITNVRSMYLTICFKRLSYAIPNHQTRDEEDLQSDSSQHQREGSVGLISRRCVCVCLWLVCLIVY